MVPDVRRAGDRGGLELLRAGVQLHTDGRPAHLAAPENHVPRHVPAGAWVKGLAFCVGLALGSWGLRYRVALTIG